MYRNCIFCSRDLGRNESIESFQVGARLAFDSWQGRSGWCARRAGVEPDPARGEVGGGGRFFRDTRMRVQRENIRLAKLEDGTRLIRIGEALPGEIAAALRNALLARRRVRGRRRVLGVFGVVWAGLAFAGVLGSRRLLQLATLAWSTGKGSTCSVVSPRTARPRGAAGAASIPAQRRAADTSEGGVWL